MTSSAMTAAATNLTTSAMTAAATGLTTASFTDQMNISIIVQTADARWARGSNWDRHAGHCPNN
tara:strand:+ start:301 stop:492 length:192 start_codon:yes stop_codon:yes gene_type:complete